MSTVFAIASGGAVGAVMRYGINHWITQITSSDFPLGIMICNIVGSFVMGAMVASFTHIWDAPQSVKLFAMTGVLGAFTTFSAFSLDTIKLIENGHITQAAIYVIGSVSLAILGLAAGLYSVRMIVS